MSAGPLAVIAERARRALAESAVTPAAPAGLGWRVDLLTRALRDITDVCDHAQAHPPLTEGRNRDDDHQPAA